jgi:hypothetical protein
MMGDDRHLVETAVAEPCGFSAKMPSWQLV